MNPNNSKSRARTTVILLSSGFLISISVLTFQQQIPNIFQTPTIYDKEYINALKNVGNLIPKNETLTAIGSYPQFTYFTGHKVKIPWVETEKTLVEFMWKINSSHLLVPENTSGPKADNSPLLIQLVEKPFEKIFNYYYDYVADPQVHKKGIMGIVKKNTFENLFEKLSDFKTEGSILHLYKLRSNITSNNLGLVTDGTVFTTPVLKDTGLHVQTVASGLSNPTSMTFIGPDDILVLEKNSGQVKRVKNGVVLSGSLLDLNVANSVESGLLGIDVVSVKNSTTKFEVFLYYTASSIDGGPPIANKLAKYDLVIDPNEGPSQGKMTLASVLLNLPAAIHHNGGKVMVGPDANVYTVIGDLSMSGERVGNTQTQNSETGPLPDGTGGILRVSQDGKEVGTGIIGSNNPSNLYYSYGVRNSFGFDFDTLTGKLWDTEAGAALNDEINAVEPGFNSGWTDIMGFAREGFMLSKLANFNGKGKYSEPEFIWTHPVTPTALKFFTSSNLGARYQNDMFVADFNNGRIYDFNLNSARTGLALNGVLGDKIANTDLELEQVIFGEGFGHVTDLKVGEGDGYLYVLSHFHGAIYKILPKPVTAPISLDKISQKPTDKKLFRGSTISTQERSYGDQHTSAINQVPQDTFNNYSVTLESTKVINAAGGKDNMDNIIWSARNMIGK